MKTVFKLSYARHIIAINLVLLGASSCKKHPGAAGTTNLGAVTSTIPRTITPTKELAMTPHKIIRYQQQSLKSCLITSIYMLVHSMRGTNATVNESETEYKFDGTHNKNNPNEKKLATDNDLIYHHILLENTLGITPSTDPSYTYSDFKNTVNILTEILKIGPFVLGATGHAILVIGIEKQSGTLVYVDPMSANINKSCSIFNPFLAGISELYYPNNYVKQPTQHYTPTQEEEQNFQKLKLDGTKKGPEEYKP